MAPDWLPPTKYHGAGRVMQQAAQSPRERERALTDVSLDSNRGVRAESARRRGGARGSWGPFTVELREGVPGELLSCQVTKRRGETIRARVLERLEPSPRAVAPACEHAASCGGCSFQDSAYDLQLEQLHARLEDLLAPLRARHPFPVAPVLGGEALGAPLFGYRNKMDFTFGARRWVEARDDAPAAPKDFALGLHAPGRHDKVLDVTTCAIAFPAANPVLAAARELALELGLAPWDPTTHEGLLRHLVLRTAEATGELLVYLVTSSQAGVERVEDYVARLVARCPAITTVVHGVRDAVSSVAEGETDRVLVGPGFVREGLGEVTFEVSARSFFQTNTRAAAGLFRIVAEEACPTHAEVVHDLYCGAGSIALLLAGSCREVWGFERVPEAVEDARRNAAAAGIDNARFVAGDVLETASAAGLAALGAPAPDVVVVDPPRAGLHPGVRAFLVERAASGAGRRLVYVSCNPKAAAVDLEELVDGGYRVLGARPVDLFPHTPHLEVVFTLVFEGAPAAGEPRDADGAVSATHAGHTEGEPAHDGPANPEPDRG